jgi:hypothetical protein
VLPEQENNGSGGKKGPPGRIEPNLDGYDHRLLVNISGSPAPVDLITGKTESFYGINRHRHAFCFIEHEVKPSNGITGAAQ